MDSTIPPGCFFGLVPRSARSKEVRGGNLERIQSRGPLTDTSSSSNGWKMSGRKEGRKEAAA